MNIIIVGVLDVKSSTNVSIAKAFMKLGFTVIPVNYRTIIQQYGHEFFENLLLEAVKKYKPVLTIFCKCNGIDSGIIVKCNKYTKTWLWNMDPIQTIKRCPEVIQHAIVANFSSCTGGGVSEYFRRHGVSNCHTIFDGLDYDLYKPTNADNGYKADISFIGNKTPERDELKEILESISEPSHINPYCNFTVKFYGQGYIKPVYNEEFSKVCSSSKMMLSLNTYNDIPDYFSNRLLRYMGCGACVIHYDPTETLHKYFEDGKEIILFKKKKELIEKIKDTGEIRGKFNIGKIAFNGRHKVLNNYTWVHTALRILEKIK